MTVIFLGYKYFADDLRAISRLRGSALKKIDVLCTEMTVSQDPMSQPLTLNDIERVSHFVKLLETFYQGLEC